MKKLYGVLGNPIEHSMSPLIHNDAFKRNGVEGDYLPFLVEEDALEKAVNGLKAIGAGGFNITVPFKEKVIPYMDELDPFAKEVGAVNTAVIKDGVITGYNTDGPGFVKSLAPLIDHLFSGKKVLVIGGGGAARGIYCAMAKTEAGRVDIANRTLSAARKIVSDCHNGKPSDVLSLADAEKSLSIYDIIIQTTSVGLSSLNESPISLLGIKEKTVVCDIIYNPLKTKFLREAEDNGAIIQTGVDMFVHQAALAFELWTGISPDCERMRELVLEKLGG